MVECRSSPYEFRTDSCRRSKPQKSVNLCHADRQYEIRNSIPI